MSNRSISRKVMAQLTSKRMSIYKSNVEPPPFWKWVKCTKKNNIWVIPYLISCFSSNLQLKKQFTTIPLLTPLKYGCQEKIQRNLTIVWNYQYIGGLIGKKIKIKNIGEQGLDVFTWIDSPEWTYFFWRSELYFLTHPDSA